MSAVPSLRLNSGASMPQFGLGTWPLNDAQVADAVVAAAEVGYRHIDTATRYGNEAGVGEGLRRTGLPREDFFVTTKLDGPFQGDDRAVLGLRESLDRMGLEYVDLLLIHWPLPSGGQYVSTWSTFEGLARAGAARSIGVSNFKPAHLEVLARETGTVPAVNQIELSPYVPRVAERAYHAGHAIATVSWSPLGGADSPLLREPVVVALAARHGCTPGQVVLAWHLRLGLAVIPKTARPQRMVENLGAGKVALSPADLDALGALAKDPTAGVDSDRTGH